MGYAHLAREERYYICQAVKSGTSLRAIAKAIGRSVSTVSRELARNTGARGYRYRQAHKRSQKRQTSKGKKRIGLEVWTYVEQCLHQDFSPEQISGVLKRKGFALSHEWIYQYILADKNEEERCTAICAASANANDDMANPTDEVKSRGVSA